MAAIYTAVDLQRQMQEMQAEMTRLREDTDRRLNAAEAKYLANEKSVTQANDTARKATTEAQEAKLEVKRLSSGR